MLPLRDHAGLPEGARGCLERLLGHLRTLEEALRLFSVQPTPPSLVELVAQDEYTHDVVVPLDERHYLAFDTT